MLSPCLANTFSFCHEKPFFLPQTLGNSDTIYDCILHPNLEPTVEIHEGNILSSITTTRALKEHSRSGIQHYS